MKPEIFMDDFERIEGDDAGYAAIGRALTFASRFEAMCKTLSVLVGLKSHSSLLDSEEQLKTFFDKLHKMPLARHLSSLKLEVESAATILDEARKARNEIAHEVALGLDRSLDSLPEGSMKDLLDRLRILSARLAEGDRIVSYLASIATNEAIPSAEFLRNYPQMVADWVCDL